MSRSISVKNALLSPVVLIRKLLTMDRTMPLPNAARFMRPGPKQFRKIVAEKTAKPSWRIRDRGEFLVQSVYDLKRGPAAGVRGTGTSRDLQPARFGDSSARDNGEAVRS
jgi:hypothetical protein